MIKWISCSVFRPSVQSFLNEYASLIVAESLTLTAADNFIQVTFMLKETFNDEDELEECLSKRRLYEQEQSVIS